MVVLSNFAGELELLAGGDVAGAALVEDFRRALPLVFFTIMVLSNLRPQRNIDTELDKTRLFEIGRLANRHQCSSEIASSPAPSTSGSSPPASLDKAR